MQPEPPRRGRLAVFNAVGLMGVPVQLGCLWILHALLDVPDTAATALAVEMAILHNFLWHLRWTWGDRRRTGAGVIQRFVRFNLAAGAVSIAGNVILTTLLMQEHLPLLAANAVAILVCSSLNYVLSDRFVFAAVGCTLAVCVASGTAEAAGLRPEASLAFERYVHLIEARLDGESRDDRPFLWLDRLAGSERQAAEQALDLGEVLTSRLVAKDGGEPIPFPGALCHHWMGTVWIPGVKLANVVALMQSYGDYQTIYHPAVRRSAILSRTGERFTVSLQLFQKKIVSVVLNTESDITYLRVSPSRTQVRSVGTRIAEVDRAGTAREQERVPGQDGGFLWRFNNYCALDERATGVYVQCESLSLSRDVPTGLGWLIDPFVNSVPRDSLEFTLRALRAALVKTRS
jgi:putative flippase GtrA